MTGDDVRARNDTGKPSSRDDGRGENVRCVDSQSTDGRDGKQDGSSELGEHSERYEAEGTGRAMTTSGFKVTN